MACRISELVLESHDPDMLARFWCEVLDFVVLGHEADGSVEIGPQAGFGGVQPTIILSRTDEPRKSKSRLHIDVNATDRDQDAELERLLHVGARTVDMVRPGKKTGTCSPTLRATSSAYCELASSNREPAGNRDYVK